ncbi:hypothetical protein H9L19_05680 [Weissella diestrammenae]|uniref:Uncharacterized protein n=1 Tax=Weissella diestrammenae TaxID=1162633 RepID=A0A7G9T462_9LACO|nr:hypothetical protein [Weissella diestrammenae]MCM0583411.1 hypothetical protein [Weissella diestrammenae]QNN74887.1 hypothetical protein H9L19_05680 [Weissella diestrammenae]
MQLTGNDLIEIIKSEKIVQRAWTAEDQATIQLDSLFDFMTQQVHKNQIASGQIIISGDEPIQLWLETSLINLPLRYANQISKIVVDEPLSDVNLYMFVENPKVSRSGMRIELAASVQSYLDDSESVMAKIAAFYDRELAVINNYEEPVDSTETESK